MADRTELKTPVSWLGLHFSMLVHTKQNKSRTTKERLNHAPRYMFPTSHATLMRESHLTWFPLMSLMEKPFSSLSVSSGTRATWRNALKF
ncbi:hypothetical protein HZ326_17092 [Fusarium oxysporum f. sp. albedinis]|nr:hypothetical protein HZ326_17092 [Fusarium oxysporum f. sp. albedinis]